MAATAVYLGVDLGTSSVKAVLLDALGRTVADAQVRYGVSRPRPSWAEQDPEAWWRACCEAIRAVLGAGAFDVRAVGLSGQMHGLVLVDAAGAPLRPAIIWSDARSGAQVREWDRVVGGDAVEAITGMPVATGMLGVSLSWVRENEPETYLAARYAVLPKDYVRFRLIGEIATEATDAAGSLLYAVREREPALGIAAALGLDAALLPPIGQSLSTAGAVTAEAGEATGLAPGTPVAFGGGDQQMAALALGLEDAGSAAAAISSGGTVVRRTPAPLEPASGVHVMPAARPEQWFAMGVVLAAGLAVDWVVTGLLGRPTASPAAIERIMAEAAGVPRGADGLMASPHLGGTRTPVVDARARAHLFGLGYQHSGAHAARAVVEGVCLSLAGSLARMSTAGEPVRRLVMTGGGARFPLWRQTLADAAGLPVLVSSDLEHAAMGAAMAGAAAVGEEIAFDPAERIRMTVEPDPAGVELYRERAGTLAALEAAVGPLLRGAPA
ncbi:xylulokinase [Leucobacter sp. CSA1]|uniref:Xylulose kinase n=1 Tax=Leucobacter chromiisoli TaxID=2796471 RepID=A0A934Q7M3_9MICO|nr:xylulokinase [Leucobacter chromiisoli]MBK0418840.1 xylulokinase [Leucobacter chromiisoli]